MVSANAAALANMLEAARRAGAEEACGALLGHSDYIASWDISIALTVPNTAAEPNTHYLIPGDTVRALERTADSSGLQIVGFFHSHPNGTAVPSPTDRDQAWPGYVYAIVDPLDGGVRFWNLDPADRTFSEVGLTER
jgi:desampylase